MKVLCLKLLERHLVVSYKCTTFAVGIVLPRTSAVIIHLIVGGRDSHPHAELGHHWFFATCGTIIHIHPDAAFAQDGVVHLHVSGFFPYSGATGKPCGMLVVVFGFPEIGFQRRLQHFLAINNPGGEGIAHNRDIVGGWFGFRCSRLRELVWTYDELFASHSEPPICPCGGVAKSCGNVEGEFRIRTATLHGFLDGWEDEMLSLQSQCS